MSFSDLKKARTFAGIQTFGDAIKVNDTTDSTSTTTGSIVTAGGLGVAKNIYSTGLYLRDGDVAGSLGADSGATTLTDATNKALRLGVPSYNTSEEDTCLFFAFNSVANNNLSIGGGTGSFNAVTKLAFVVAPNQTTTTGTEAIAIQSTGITSAVPFIQNDTTDSTSTTTGSIQTDGGLGVAKRSYFGNEISIRAGASGGVVQRWYSSDGNRNAALAVPANGDTASPFIFSTGNSWKFYVDDSTTGVKLESDDTAWSSASDNRLKTDIVKLSGGLDMIDKINPYYFRYKTDIEGMKRVGVIAQEIQEVCPEAVTVDENGYLGVKYTELIPMLISAIKEQKNEIETLKEKIK